MSNALARKYRVDVTADLSLASGFLQLNGINDFNDDITPNLEDSSAYDTTGWTTREVTMQDGQLTATFFRRLNAGVYDPGQEIVRSCRGQFGDAARCGVRWYDKQGGPEAYSGVFVPTWKRSATGVKALEAVTATFDVTDIPINLNIANPIAGAALPVVTRATPTAQTAGNTLTISGGGFTGTTGITIGGVAVGTGKFTVLSDATIVAVVPAGAAGSAPIIVTNGAGASTAFPYVRGA
jgi:hypothetical protein